MRCMRRLAALDPFLSVAHDDNAYAIISRSQSAADGRARAAFALPDEMIEHAGLKDHIVFVGMAQKFQIWDAGTFRTHRRRTHCPNEGGA